MSPLRYYAQLIIVYLIGSFWGFLVLLQALRLAITKPRKFFQWKTRKNPPKCLENPEFGTHGYAQVGNGVKIHYVASGSSTKPLMLLLHGFPEFWYSWRHQILAFNKHYRVVAANLRGYGESSAPKGVDNYRLPELIEDIKGLIPALGYSSAIVVGHDWGGALTWTFTAKYPEMVEKAIIMNCPQPVAMQETMSRSIKQLLMSWYMFFFQLPYFPELFFFSGDNKMLENAFCGKNMGAKKGAFTEDDLEAFKYTFSKPFKYTAPMNYIRAGLTPEKSEKTRKLPRYIEKVPVLLLWGTRDGALSKGMAETSRKYAKDFQLEYIEGASHWVQQDEPDIVNKHMFKFLKLE